MGCSLKFDSADKALGHIIGPQEQAAVIAMLKSDFKKADKILAPIAKDSFQGALVVSRLCLGNAPTLKDRYTTIMHRFLEEEVKNLEEPRAKGCQPQPPEVLTPPAPRNRGWSLRNRKYQKLADGIQ